MIMKKTNSIEQFFKLSNYDSNVRQEIIGGLTTFATMLYVFAVIPSMLEEAGIPQGPVTTALILMAGLTTVAMGLFTNRPFALAPGLGSVAFLSVTLAQAEGISWEIGRGMVFVSCILFVLFIFLGLRLILLNLMPLSVPLPIGAGIVFYISRIGFIFEYIVAADESSVDFVLGYIGSPGAILTIFG